MQLNSINSSQWTNNLIMATNEFHIATKTGTGIGKFWFPGKSIFTEMEPKMLSLKWIMSKCDQFVPVLNTMELIIYFDKTVH